MISKLNDDLQKEVDAHGGQPFVVEHPGTHKLYVIVDNDTHERAMQALREREEARELAQLAEDIAEGEADIEAGRVKPLDEAFADIRKKLG